MAAPAPWAQTKRAIGRSGLVVRNEMVKLLISLRYSAHVGDARWCEAIAGI
jgi:hypothetical protein